MISDNDRNEISCVAPGPTSATRRWNPGRSSAEAAERPRSSSMTTICSERQPSWRARSASAYCRRVDSWCCRTWRAVDCRTYTTAFRSRCRVRILSRGSGRAALGRVALIGHLRIPRRHRREALADQLADQHDEAALPLARQILPADPLLPRTLHGGPPSTGPARAGPRGPPAALQERHIQRCRVQMVSITLSSGHFGGSGTSVTLGGTA